MIVFYDFHDIGSIFRYKYRLTGFVVDTDCVLCEVRRESLYIIQLNLAFKWLKFLILSYMQLILSYDIATLFYYFMF